MSLKKGAWSPEEDKKLIEYINRYGIWNWSKMAEPAGLKRSGKSCRLRWLNYLSPKVRRGNFTCEEDETITRMHKALGNKWSTMAAALPGRTDNEIKNRWHTHLKKRLRKLVTKQPHVSSTMSDDHEVDTSQLNLLPKYEFTGSPISPLPYGFESSQDTSSSNCTLVETSETKKNIEESNLPNFGEDLYKESYEQAIDESGFFHPFNEFWDLELKNPFNSYSSGSCDLWTDFPVSADMDEVFIEPLFQF